MNILSCLHVDTTKLEEAKGRWGDQNKEPPIPIPFNASKSFLWKKIIAPQIFNPKSKVFKLKW